MVTIKGFIGQILNTETQFNILFKNPCTQEGMVVITKSQLPTELSYTLKSHQAEGGLKLSHEPFFATSQTIDASLCGSLTYTATFGGQELSIDTTPMSYNTDRMEFSLFTDDASLVGQQTITLSAHLTEYPTVSSDEPPVSTTIEIVDQCASLNSITAQE